MHAHRYEKTTSKSYIIRENPGIGCITSVCSHTQARSQTQENISISMAKKNMGSGGKFILALYLSWSHHLLAAPFSPRNLYAMRVPVLMPGSQPLPIMPVGKPDETPAKQTEVKLIEAPCRQIGIPERQAIHYPSIIKSRRQNHHHHPFVRHLIGRLAQNPS